MFMFIREGCEKITPVMDNKWNQFVSRIPILARKTINSAVAESNNLSYYPQQNWASNNVKATPDLGKRKVQSSFLECFVGSVKFDDMCKKKLYNEGFHPNSIS